MRVLRVLLWLLPGEFRREYGGELLETAQDRWRERGRSFGLFGRLWFWIREWLAVVRACFGTRRRRGAEENRYGAYGVTLESAGVARRQEAGRDMWIGRWLDDWSRDIRHAGRAILRSPGFAATAVLSLALGIGATTAIFGAVNGVLLRPLPYPESDHLVTIWQDHSARGQAQEARFNPEDFHDLRRRSTTLDGVASMTSRSRTLTGIGEAEQVEAMTVSHEYFDLLGARPELGRTFRADETPGEALVVLSHGLWQRAFGGDPSAVGARIVLDGGTYSIVGVVPALFRPVGGEPELWLWGAPPDDVEADTRDFRVIDVFGRLAPGVDVEQARAELAMIASDLQAEYPTSNAGVDFRLARMEERVVAPVRRALIVLLGAVGFVLLITCINIANLLLARSGTRSREMALRSTLGAGRSRLVRQLLTESSLLALLGSVLGLLVAQLCLRLVVGLAPPQTPRLEEIAIDHLVLGFGLTVSLFSGLLFGLLPAFQGATPALTRLLSEGTKGAGATTASHRLRSALIIGQLAVTLVLVTAAGLMMRSFLQLQSVDPGFRSENVLVADLSLVGPDWDSRNKADFYDELFRRLESQPNVHSAGAVSFLPMRRSGNQAWFEPEGWPEARPGERPVAGYRVATGGYFRAMGIPLLRGRSFNERDHIDAPRVAILNETAAHTFWPGEDPIGKRFTWQGGMDEPVTVIGVVGDVRHEALDWPPRAEMYGSGIQFWTGQTSIVVHTDADPLAIVPALRSTTRALDPNLPVSAIATMESLLRQSIAMPRLYLALFAAFGALALILAIVGVYGVTSRAVSERTHEIGIRVAVGAGQDQVLGMVLRRTLALILPGLALGIGGALALTRVLDGLLFELSPTDPFTFATVAVVLAAAALLAAYLPARRAARVDPVIALRAD